MNLGVSIKNGMDKELSRTHIDFFKEHGIRHLELTFTDPGAGPVLPEDYQNKIAGLADLFTISCHATMRPNFVHPVKRTRMDGLRMLEDMLEVCDRIGATWLTIHIGAIIGLKRYMGHKLDRFAEELNALYDRRGFATPVCIENMPVVHAHRLTGESFSELERVLRQVQDSRCGLLLDTGHYFLMHDSRISDPAVLSRTRGVHVHNNYGSRDDHNYIYDGVHDPAQLIKDIVAAAPDAKLIFENYRMDFSSILKSIEYLNNIL